MATTEEESVMSPSSWVVDIQSKIGEPNNPSKESEQWTHRSIYVVPSSVKGLKKAAYQPAVVSFGPYHHGDEHLLPMEKHKQRALLHFLRRAGRALEDFLRPLEEDLPLLMAAYERLDGRWREGGGHRFLKLMVFDGCFMLEVLRFYVTPKVGVDYAANDPIFSQHGVLNTVPYIKGDMMMMENQIPLLVLRKLIAVESDYGGQITEDTKDIINRLVLSFFAPKGLHPKMPDLGLHVLDVFRKSLLQGPEKRKRRKCKCGDIPMDGDGSYCSIVRSATELDEAGVRMKVSHTNSLRDVRFKRGILWLPRMDVDDATESLLLNLMAFERLHLGATKEVTSYVFFMVSIVNSVKDVRLLHSRKILRSSLGNDEGVAKIFNSLSKDVTIGPDNILDKVHRRVNEYCGKSYNRWRATLLHTYFRSPWSFMSLAAAIFLLGLTVAQTAFTMLSYHKHQPSPPTG